MRARLRAAIGAALLVAAATAAPVGAQAVRIRVVAGDPERPVPGALLSLQTEAGRRIAQTLSDESGRAVLQAPGAGRYRIRADRIGYSGTLSDPFIVEAGAATSFVVSMPDTRVLLPELTVRSSRSVCRLGEESGSALAAVWDEARKALTGTQLTRSVRPPEIDVTTFVQDLDREGRVTAERSQTDRRRVARPFVAADPAGLIERGFAEERDGDMWFSAPDADLLLSDEFLETHCFRVVRGERADTGLVGLAFEPARGRRVPEVRGILWLDRASSELRYLEFTYLNLDRQFETGHEGGRLEFERLRSGEWIVSEWIIRTPIVGRIRGRGLDGMPLDRDTLLGRRETGGRAAVVAGGAPPTAAVVAGTVFDSTSGAPLDGAVVSLAGGSYADTTDASGRFRIEAPNRGNFLITAEHRTIALLGLERLSGAARLERGAVATVDFAVPPLDRIAGALCAGVDVGAGGAGIVAGYVRDSTGGPAAAASFDVRWTGGDAGRPGRVTVTADDRGAFRLCGLPTRTRLLLRGPSGVAALPGTVTLAGARLTLADVSLLPRHRVATPASITVRVRDSARAAPLEDALLVLEPSGDSTRSDASGTARFPSIPSGIHVLTIRALGFGDVEREIETTPGDTVVTIALPPTAVTLAAIEVSGRAAETHPRMAAFEERRREANGHFFTREQLQPREGSPLSGVLRQTVGVRLVPRPSPCTGYAAASGRRAFATTGGHACQGANFAPACYLAVFVNGSVFWREGMAEPPPDVDQFRVDDLEGIEVYAGEAQVPAAFQSTGSACGALVLWPRVTIRDR